MKERIFKYLLEAGKGVAAVQILSDVLNIRSPSAASSDRVLAVLLERDPRFVLRGGIWRLSSPNDEAVQFDFGQAVVLHLQSANRFEIRRELRGAIRWPDGLLQEFITPVLPGALRRLRSGLEGHLVIVWSSRELWLLNGWLRSQGLESWGGETIFLRDLAARALKRTLSKLQLEDLAPELGLSPADEERPHEVVQHLNACWVMLRGMVPSHFCRNPGTLRGYIDSPASTVDFSCFAFGPGFLRQLPGAAGVYVMKDRRGAVLYVGKSRNLKRRVASYFTPRALSDPKTARMHEGLYSIDIHRTDNEIEALILEMRLIKDFRPAINLQTEVHGRRAARHRGGSLLLFVVDSEQKAVKIYFFHDGVFAGRNSALMGRPPSKRLRKKIQSVFFTTGRTRKSRGEDWEKEIAFRWLAANRKRLNFLDVDEAGSFASVLELLRRYLCDPDRLARKVYYR